MIFRYSLAAAMLVGACYAALLATASVLFEWNSRPSIEVAARLVPYNSAYLVRLSGWEPQSATAILKRAVSLNPYEVQAWLRLGFEAEFHRHDERAAESAYLQAAAVNHMFLPKSTLANFYFRHENGVEFLKWAKAALSITPYPPTPILAQMWLLDPNPAQLAEHIPDRPGVLSQYAAFLMNARQFAAIPPIIKRLVAAAGKNNPEWYGLSDTIGPMEDHLIEAGSSDIALQIWGTIGSAGWISLPVPTPASPLTNGNFRVPVWGHGFDWAAIANDGVFSSQERAAGEMRLEFSGDEPEHLVLLQQWIPVAPGRPYRLRWNLTSTGLAAPTGLAWGLHGDHVNLVSGDILAHDAGGSWVFQAPSGRQACLLTLGYSRPLGQTRVSGTLVLRSLALRPEELSSSDR